MTEAPQRLLLPALLAAGLLGAGQARADQPWTLDRAIDTCLRQNPDARIARERSSEADALIQSAEATWYPHLSLQGRYTESNSPLVAFGSILNERAFSFALDFNHPGRVDDLNGSGTLAYNLYSGGRATAGLEAAREGARAAAEDLRAATNGLSTAVVRAYLDIVKAREAIRALDAGVAAYEAMLRSGKARFDAGNLLKADLLSLQVQLAQTREERSLAQRAEALAKRAFGAALGLDDPAQAVSVADTDPSLERLTVPSGNDASSRPELAGMQARVKAAEAMERAARGSRRPVANAFASYQLDRGWVLDHQGTSWMAGVAVDLPVFDGGETTSRIRQAASQVAQAREQLRKLAQQISLQIEEARLSCESARERLEVSDETVRQAEESAALSKARFDKGLLETSTLIATEGRLIEARMRRTLAEADLRLAIASYRGALGLPPLSSP